VNHRAWAALVVSVVFLACADQVAVAPRASRDLVGRVEAIRVAAEGDDRAAARAELQDLIDAVERWHARGLIDDERASGILAAAADVLRHLDLIAAPSPSPSPEPDEDQGDEGHGDEHGNAHGHDEGHGNDEGKD
jgi:hypothetical protein